MELACVTGIPPSVWAAEGEQAFVTAFELLKPRKRGSEEDDEDDEPQMSG